MNEIGISQTEMGTFQRCPRMWYLKYYLGMVPADEPPVGNRILGIRIHAALEGWYWGELDPVNTLGILYWIEKSKHPEWATELDTESRLAVTMIQGYLEWVAAEGVDADFEVIAAEQEIRLALPGVDGVDLRCRMDQVYRRISNGRLGFMDYKTGSSFDRAEDLALDPQMPFYCLMQQMAAHGEPVPGMEYRPDRVIVTGGTIRSLKRVLRTEKSKPPFYQTNDFWYTPEQIMATLARVQSVCTQIKIVREGLDEAYQRSGGDLDYINHVQRFLLPPNKIVGDCSWRCEFAKTCPMMDDGSDWPGVLVRSGRYVQGDPYSYYGRDALSSIRADLEPA